jgi:polygalacturonase
MKSDKIILLLFFFGIYLNLQAEEYKITAFGALPDTSFLSTSAIQKAIDACYQNGGGRVLIPAGHYKTGTIILKSNVNLHLESGAILYGSRNLDDYIKLKPAYISLRTQTATIQLIYAENADNVSITGLGEIDGQGDGFKKLSWNDEGITRPHLLRFITCTHVNIENISLKNSGCWMQHYLACEQVRIHGVRVLNRNNYNNDGLDLDGCRNVTVSDFISDSDDDGITLKSTSPRPCENITITNCVVSSRCNAIKMGTESNGGFKNIAVSNCVVKPSSMEAPEFFGKKGGISAIALEIVDGGTMEGIAINNVQVDGTEVPIFIRLGNRARSYQEGVMIDHVGTLGDITISNVRAKHAGVTGCSITGLPGNNVSNIRLSNIAISQEGGVLRDSINWNIEEKPQDYPEAIMFGTLPASGFFVRHAENIVFDAVQLDTKNVDMRPVFYFDEAKSCILSNSLLQGNNKGEREVIALHKCRRFLIKNNVMKADGVSSEQSADIRIVSNNGF